MLKSFIVLILLSLGVVFALPHLQPFITLLMSAHDWLSQLLLQVFAGGQAGSIIRALLALLILPLGLSAIPALIYWFAKRRPFPYFMTMSWVLWLVQTTALIVHYHAAT